MQYSANLLGLEKAAARQVDFGAIGAYIDDQLQNSLDFNKYPKTEAGVDQWTADVDNVRTMGAVIRNKLSYPNIRSELENLYMQEQKEGLSGEEFVKKLADHYGNLDDPAYKDFVAALGINPVQFRDAIYRDTRNIPLPDDKNQLRYILHSQLGIPINNHSAANIPFWDKLQSQNYEQLYPGLGVAALATPVASMFGLGAGAGAGLGGAAGTLLGNYIADARGNHLVDDMIPAGTLGSILGSVGGAVGGHMLQNSFKGKKNKKEDE